MLLESSQRERGPARFGTSASSPVSEQIPIVFSCPVGGNSLWQLQKTDTPVLGTPLTLLCCWSHLYTTQSLNTFHILGTVLGFRYLVIRKTGTLSVQISQREATVGGQTIERRSGWRLSQQPCPASKCVLRNFATFSERQVVDAGGINCVACQGHC